MVFISNPVSSFSLISPGELRGVRSSAVDTELCLILRLRAYVFLSSSCLLWTTFSTSRFILPSLRGKYRYQQLLLCSLCVGMCQTCRNGSHTACMTTCMHNHEYYSHNETCGYIDTYLHTYTHTYIHTHTHTYNLYINMHALLCYLSIVKYFQPLFLFCFHLFVCNTLTWGLASKALRLRTLNYKHHLHPLAHYSPVPLIVSPVKVH